MEVIHGLDPAVGGNRYGDGFVWVNSKGVLLAPGAAGACNAILVGEIPTCSVPALRGCEGQWCLRLRPCMLLIAPPPPAREAPTNIWQLPVVCSEGVRRCRGSLVWFD